MLAQFYCTFLRSTTVVQAHGTPVAGTRVFDGRVIPVLLQGASSVVVLYSRFQSTYWATVP
jgi:hypothetical protein